MTSQSGDSSLNPAPMRFTWREFSGGLGDLGVFLPLSVAMAISCDMDLGLIFIFAGLMNVLSGWWFRQPIPVQPMKAIAAIAIAEGLTAGEVSAAGLGVGVAVLVIALTGLMDSINRWIPRPVVRGIQAGVGAKLVLTGMGVKLGWREGAFQAGIANNGLFSLPAIGWDSWLTAAAVTTALVILLRRRQPVLLYIFAAGFVLLAFTHMQLYRSLTWRLPTFVWAWPAMADWSAGLFKGALPQLPLTLLNSVVAVCALSEDYFPGQGVPPRRMAVSVSLMNLLCVSFGGMPMCHGAGGLAAQYHFGARTGGSVVMLGALKIAVGLLIGAALLPALQAYPNAILSVMIITAGLTLARAARDSLFGRPLILVLVTAATIVAVNTLAGFLVGLILVAAMALPARFRR